jgi:cohesin loading factor subunit SCC2
MGITSGTGKLSRRVEVYVEVPTLELLHTPSAGVVRQHRAQLFELLQVVRVVLPEINRLVHNDMTAMSDGIVIQAVYIDIGPFFLVESKAEKCKRGGGVGAGGKGKVEMEKVVGKTLGMSALSGLRLDEPRCFGVSIQK